MAGRWNGILICAITAVVLVFATIVAHTQPPSAPANDNCLPGNSCGDAILIKTNPFSSTQDVSAATEQGLDPRPSCLDPGVPVAYKTVWYKLSATSASTVVADTFSSTYDTVLSVYTAKITNNNIQFTEVACNDDWQLGNLTSQIQFQSTAAVNYYFMVASFTPSAATLNFHVNVASMPPSNDNWPTSADCSNPNNPPAGVACAIPFTNTVPNYQATTQGTDPIASCGDAQIPQKTIWYRYTPPFDMYVTADTIDATYDTILSVYTGAPGSFAEVACGDDQVGVQSSVSFVATGGTTYSFMVSAYQGVNGVLTFKLNKIATQLTLIKSVVNNNGGTKTLSDFPLSATGPTPINGVSGSAAVTNKDVSAGNYTLSEASVAGYTASLWSCSGGSFNNNVVTLQWGQTASCTITNDDQPATLTLTKVIINDNGGTKSVSDFPLAATGPTPISGVSGTGNVTNRAVNAGTYTLSETNVQGYTASAWNCSGGTQNGNSVTLGVGVSATCVIGNNDNPAHLTLVKIVTNNSGGTKTVSDFPLTATGPTTITGISGTTPVTNAIVNAGSYTLTETTVAGYTASAWSCPGFTLTGANKNVLTLALGQAATCTITNADPKKRRGQITSQ